MLVIIAPGWLSMESYRLLLFLHVLSVVVAFGVTFAYPFLQAAAERQGVETTRFVLRAIDRIEKVVVYPGSALVFLFGAGLIFDDRTGYKDDFPGWLMAAITWYILAVVVAVFVQRPNVKRAMALLEGAPDGALPAEYDPIGKRMQMVGGLLALSVIGIAFLMVWGREGGF